MPLSPRNDHIVDILGLFDSLDPIEVDGDPKWINNATGTWEIRTLEYPAGLQVASGSVVPVGSGGNYYCELSDSIAILANTNYWLHVVITGPTPGFYVADFSLSFAVLSRTGNTPTS